MDAFLIRGGRTLSGTIRVGGAKNSALKLIAAALLAEGRFRLFNVPDIADIATMSAVVTHLGARVERDGVTLIVDVPGELGTSTPPELVQRLRASLVVLGPLLARTGRARVAQPGGCNLGSRGIDMHLAGLSALGAHITYGPDYVEAVTDGLVGADIELPYPSVGATENLLMAAATARGTTRIVNAAREPEIADLAAFLNAMGARISGAGTSDIVIEGTPRLVPADHTVVGDRIEAGTYVAAAALAGGEVRITGVRPDHLRLALAKTRALGIDLEEGEDHLLVYGPAAGATAQGGDAPGTGLRRRRLRGLDIVTLPYPGFPTDLQPMWLVVLSQAVGTSLLTENVFDGRFSIVGELRRMGADISLEGHHAVVRGPTPLHGTTVRATDLRAGAALVLAGLVADGETVVTEPHHVDRGYADLAGRLRALGADVQRVEVAAALSA